MEEHVKLGDGDIICGCAKGVLELRLKHSDWLELEHQMRGNSLSNQVCNTIKRDVAVILTTIFHSVIASHSALVSRQKD